MGKSSVSEAIASVLIDAGRIVKGLNSIDALLGLEDDDDSDDVIGRFDDVEESND